MTTKYKIKSILKKPVVMLVILIGGLVLAGCAAGLGAVPRGWSGGVITDGTLFIGSQTGNIVAADLKNGSLLFSAPLEAETESSGGFLNCVPTSSAVAIYGTPSVGNDLVYVGGYNGKVYAFKLGEFRNEPQWISPRTEETYGAIVGGTVFNGNKVYFAADNQKVYALDADAGFQEWEFETGDKIWSTPAVDGNTLYVGSFDNKLYALDTADGSQKWNFEAEGAIVTTPEVSNNSVYFGSFDRYLYALNAVDGNLKWKFIAENWFWAKPLVRNNSVYAANLDGKVYVLDATSGNKKSEFDLGSPISSSPVFVDNWLIVATEDGGVYALDTESSRQRQLVALGERVSAPLAASQGNAYIHSSTGALYEVNIETGALRDIKISP